MHKSFKGPVLRKYESYFLKQKDFETIGLQKSYSQLTTVSCFLLLGVPLRKSAQLLRVCLSDRVTYSLNASQSELNTSANSVLWEAEAEQPTWVLLESSSGEDAELRSGSHMAGTVPAEAYRALCCTVAV